MILTVTCAPTAQAFIDLLGSAPVMGDSSPGQFVWALVCLFGCIDGVNINTRQSATKQKGRRAFLLLVIGVPLFRN